MSASSEADAAIRALADAARAFAAQKLQRNVSGLYARALRKLVDAARVFARKSDEEWAAEVAELRAELEKARSIRSVT